MTRGMVRWIIVIAGAIALAAMFWPINRGSDMWAVTVGTESTAVVPVGDPNWTTPLQLLFEGAPEPLVIDGLEVEHPASEELRVRLRVAGVAALAAAVGYAILRRDRPGQPQSES